MYKKEVKNIVEEVYPFIQAYYGKSKFNGEAPKVDYHHNIIPNHIEIYYSNLNLTYLLFLYLT